jgi:hypothetical protein
VSDQDNIGQFVTRVITNDRADTFFPNTIGGSHRVESMINGQPITNCGRRLQLVTKDANGRNKLRYHHSPLGAECYQCLP